jgi:hypothetical protein
MASGEKPRIHARVAETARLERAQGGQPQAHDSGDPHTARAVQKDGGAAGPHDKSDQINRHSTPGTGMLCEPGKASDDDMAPSG